MAPHGNNNNSIMNAFAAMEEEEQRQQQQQQQACFMFRGNSTINDGNIHPHGISQNNNNNNNASNAATDHASVLDKAVSPLQAFLRHQGEQQQQQQQLQQQVLFGGGGTTIRDDNEVTSRAFNPFHRDVGGDDDDDDEEEDRPLPIDSDHTDISDIRDAVDIALAQIDGDCCDTDSFIDLDDDVEEFFADIVDEKNNNSTARNVIKEAAVGGRGDDNKFVVGGGGGDHEDRPFFDDYYASTDNHDSMTSIEFAPLAGSFAATAQQQHQQQQQKYHPVSIIEGMEVLENSDVGGVPPHNNNGNMDYSSRNMGDSGRGSLASLGSLTGAFSKLNHCMQQTAHTREMIQQLSSPNLHNDVFDDDGSNYHNSCNSVPVPNQSFHSLQSLGRSQRGRPTKSLKRLTKADLLGRSSSIRSLGSANGGGVRKAPSKATLSTASTTSLRSIGSNSNSSKRRSRTQLGGQRYKKRSSSNSLSTMRNDENPLVTGIAPINWDGI